MVRSAVRAGTGCCVVGLLLLLAVATLGALGPAPAAAKVLPVEVSEYRKDFAVSATRAEESLRLQSRATQAGVVDRLEAALDSGYAGVWFDNQASELVVPVADAAGLRRAESDLAGIDLEGDFRTVAVDASWRQLQAAQDRLDETLIDLLEDGLLQTSIDPRTNAVALTLSSDIEGDDRARVEKLAAGARVDVEVRQGDREIFESQLDACTDPYCGSPLRGGVRIDDEGDPNGPCTAGFRAVGGDGHRYLLTAGHCIEMPGVPGADLHWASSDDALASHSIGEAQQWQYPGGDWAKIRATGSWWDVNPWPATVVYWGSPILNQNGAIVGKTATVDENYPITGEGRTMLGSYVCHSGFRTGTTCGTVTETEVTHSWAGLPVYELNEVTNVCSDHGDSGGPVFAANKALGMLTGSTSSICGDTMWYRDITDATDALGVSVAPRDTTVTTTATGLNGNPGWATVRGEVKAPGAPVNGSINVKLFKWEGSWALKATLPTTVTNGKFEIVNWNGVGPGQWVAQAVFPAQGPYTEGKSDSGKEGWFTVKDGYRLVAQHSGRCMDVYGANKENGAMVKQWGCDNPATVLNQVFTLVPQGGNYNLLVARHSNRCVDVNGATAADGAWIIQHVCKPPGQNDNQLWQLVDVGGGYFELRAKHSGKCIDVTGAGGGNDVQLQQWSCNGFQQQHWQFQSVDSGPIPFDVHITVPPNEVLYGQPGYVNAYGYVKSGAYPVAGRIVYVNYQKETSPGAWTTMSTSVLSLNAEGYYYQPAWQVGVGNWRVRTVLPASAPFAESISPYKYFQIKPGYLFVFRHSGKCMSLHGNLPGDGTPILQWPCASPPNPAMGQVFHIVPIVGTPYYQVKINSTGKCVDVSGASQAQGAKLEQWGCVGPNHANQLWQMVPIAGQPPWFAMIAKHSGQCADVSGKSTANGALLQQWGCTWTGNQQWQFIPVG